MNSKITAEFNNIIKEHKMSLNKNDFHQFINGLYQAEGTMGAYFKKKESLSIRFNFSIGQNYSPEALDVLLNLQKILGIGKIKLELSMKNQLHIRYKVSNTEDIFNKVIPYFSLLYGQKRKDVFSLKKVYELSNIEYSKLDNSFISELIHLVYSTNPEGKKRKLLLKEKLNQFNCSFSSYYNLKVEENNNLPSKLFIIGLFLGDGSIGFVFDSPPSRFPRFYIKLLFNFAAQSSNVQLLKLIAKKMNLKPQIYKRKSGMLGLEFTGKTVFEVIMPFLAEHIKWLFWRKDRFIYVQKIVNMFKNKDHLSKEGLKSIIDLLYSKPNKYLKPKEYWIVLIDKRVWE